MLVLIFPTSTNYHPEGYDLIVEDNRLCRGSVFYVPGASSSNFIDAKRVFHSFRLYRRQAAVAVPRKCYCSHKELALRQLKTQKQQNGRRELFAQGEDKKQTEEALRRYECAVPGASPVVLGAELEL